MSRISRRITFWQLDRHGIGTRAIGTRDISVIGQLPLNYLMVSVLERYHRLYGDDFTIEYPTGSGQHLSLDKVAADLSDRLISLFTQGNWIGSVLALVQESGEGVWVT